MNQATTNHEKIAEDIGHVLEELSEDIHFWKRQMETHKYNVAMERYIMLLYVAVSEFLCSIMGQWYRSRGVRIKSSFHSNFIDEQIRKTRDVIKVLSERLDKEANRAVQDHILSMPRFFEEKMSEFQRVLGAECQKQLRNEFTEYRRVLLEEARTVYRPTLPQQEVALHLPEAGQNHRDLCFKSSSEDITSLIEHLGQKAEDQPPKDLIEQSAGMHVDSEVMQRIQGCFQEPRSATI